MRDKKNARQEYSEQQDSASKISYSLRRRFTPSAPVGKIAHHQRWRYSVRLLLALSLCLSGLANAGYSAGALGCYPDFKSALVAICQNQNPDTTSVPPYVYYRDQCVPTTVPNFMVYAHRTHPTAPRLDFSYGGTLTTCDMPAQTVEVPESNAPDESATCPKPQFGNPIYPLTGSKKETVPTGFVVGGVPLTLTYDSSRQATAASIGVSAKSLGDLPSFGALWLSSLHRRFAVSQSAMNLKLFSGGGYIASPQNQGGDFVSDGRGSLRIAAHTLGYRNVNAVNNSIEDYNAAGQLMGRADASGNALTFSYSAAASSIAPAAGYLVQVTDNVGRRINFEYVLPTGGVAATDGRISKISNSANQAITTAYDSAGNLTALTWEDGKTRQFLYENSSLPWALTGVVDENNSRYSTFGYDTAGRAISTEYTGGVNKYSVNYDGAAPGLAIREVLDPATNTTYRYHGWLVPSSVSMTMPNGENVDLITGNILGVPVITGMSQPAGSGCLAANSASTFDARGNQVSRDDFAGKRTCHVYDDKNREILRIEGLSNTVACTAVTSDSATLPAGVRRIRRLWHPDWSLPTRVVQPGTISTVIHQGQPDPFNNNVAANCTSAAALSNGKTLPVVCKQVDQSIKTAVNPAVPQDVYLTSVGLLLKFDGVDGATVFVDDGYSSKVAAAVGTARISTLQSKFGGSSLALNGSGAYVSIPDAADLSFGSGDFTIEAWVNPSVTMNSGTGQKTFIAKWNSGTNGSWMLDHYQGNLRGVLRSGASVVTVQGAATLPAGAWAHVAFSRSGNNLYVFLNGALIGSSSSGLAVSASTTPVLLGYRGDGGGTEYFPGYMDEVRISQGVARYAANFTPASATLPSANIIDPAVPAKTNAYTYDAAGRVLSNIDAGGKTTTYVYYTSTSFTGVDPNAVGYTTGDLQRITNPAGHITQFTQYDKIGRVRQMIDPKGVVTDITYTPRGWVSTVTATAPGGAGRTTTYTYDNVGQLTSVSQPDGSTLSYSYDAAHRLVGVTDAKGNMVSYTLDNVGNRINEDIKDLTGTLQRSIGRSFDALNRVQQVTGAAR